MLLGIVPIDLRIFAFFSCAKVCSHAKHYICFNLVLQVCISFFLLVYCITCHHMCRCLIVVLLYVSIFLLVSILVSPGHVFRKYFLMVLMRLAVVRLNSAAFKYCVSSSFMFSPEHYLSRLLFVESPGVFTTFQFFGTW